MKTASGPLIALLNGSTQFMMADLYAITTISGTSLYNSSDLPITYNANVYSAAGPLMKRNGIRNSVGLETDTLRITAYASTSHLLEGLPFVKAAIGGALDNARIVLTRVFMTAWNAAPVGGVNMFSGRVSTVTGSRNKVEIEVKSDIEILSTMLPRNLVQSPCVNTLFDSACSVLRAAFAVAVTGTGGTLNTVTSANASAAGYFDQGTILALTGANAGIKRTVKSFTGGTFTMALPWPTVPANGDTYTALPGCDKTQATCNTKFSNLTHHRGYPYVPNAEVAL